MPTILALSLGRLAASANMWPVYSLSLPYPNTVLKPPLFPQIVPLRESEMQSEKALRKMEKGPI